MSHHMVELIPLFCHEPTNYTEVFARKRFLIHEIDTACIPESTEGNLIRGYRLSFCWMQAPCTHTRLGVKDSQNGSYSYLLFACIQHMAVAAMRYQSFSKAQSRFSQIVSIIHGEKRQNISTYDRTVGESPWRAPENPWRAPESLWRAPESLWRAPDSHWKAPESSWRAL